jgi:chromosome partitioning protein
MDTSADTATAVSRETATEVSRETPPAVSALTSVPRAADLVSERVPEDALAGDRSTPLAQATEHSLAVAAGRPLRRQLPRPASSRVLVVANQKGGVGKTTTTVNVAAALAQHGLKVLVIDLDPQGNASTALAVEHGEGTPGSYQVLVEGTAMDEVIVECPDVPGLFVVPATIDLAGAEIELVSLVARETRLRKALDAHLAECAEVEDSYDYVFIDCPPSLGLLTVNALSAGHEMLIPIQCEYYALEGLSQLLHTIEQIREHLNPRLKVGAIMLTMYDARTRLAAGVADEVREHFGTVVLKTAIPRSVRISEAPSYGQTVLTYDPGSAGALSYLEASAELAHQITDQQETQGAPPEESR